MHRKRSMFSLLLRSRHVHPESRVQRPGGPQAALSLNLTPEHQAAPNHYHMLGNGWFPAAKKLPACSLICQSKIRYVEGGGRGGAGDLACPCSHSFGSFRLNPFSLFTEVQEMSLPLSRPPLSFAPLQEGWISAVLLGLCVTILYDIVILGQLVHRDACSLWAHCRWMSWKESFVSPNVPKSHRSKSPSHPSMHFTFEWKQRLSVVLCGSWYPPLS